MTAEDTERDLCAVAAALLKQGRMLDGLSRPLTATSVIAAMVLPWLVPSLPASALALLLLGALAGCGQSYFALRVGFDAALFEAIAAGHHPSTPVALDAALVILKLQPATKVGRAVPLRVAGARGLLAR